VRKTALIEIDFKPVKRHSQIFQFVSEDPIT